jgi:hypothetical protein
VTERDFYAWAICYAELGQTVPLGEEAVASIVFISNRDEKKRSIHSSNVFSGPSVKSFPEQDIGVKTIELTLIRPDVQNEYSQ